MVAPALVNMQKTKYSAKKKRPQKTQVNYTIQQLLFLNLNSSKDR